MYNFTKMLFPAPIKLVTTEQASSTDGYALLKHLPRNRNVFFYLHATWPSSQGNDMLPEGYNYYIVSSHMEHIDFEWLRKQNVGPIYYLTDFNFYQDYRIENVEFLQWVNWHNALNKMILWFGTEYNKNITHKASVFCNRITQSKMIITTALLETLDEKDLLISLSDWIEKKNVHNWEPTGNRMLDNLTNIFRERYLGKKLRMDEWTNEFNLQFYTANPGQIAYQNAAIHFTNESFHYSLMDDNILPGPHLTEKTFKCLLGGTAFIPVGQFDVYRTLEKFGMHFDYGLDLSFDQDSGNLTRLEKIVKLIAQIAEIDKNDLHIRTKDSSLHNQDLILSGKFAEMCESINQKTLAVLIDKLQ